MFVIIQNEQVVLGPMPWRKLFFENFLQEEYDLHIDLPQKNTEPYIHSDFKILPARYTEEQITNTQKLNGPFWTISDSEAVGHFVAINKTIDEVKTELKTIAAQKRWEKEVGGIKLTFGEKEYTIDTSREGRNTYLQALQLGANNNSWKFPEGWVTLSITDLQTLTTQIFTHVQTCFNEEAQRIELIESKTTLNQLKGLFE